MVYSRATTSSMALRPVLPDCFLVCVLVDIAAVTGGVEGIGGRSLGGGLAGGRRR